MAGCEDAEVRAGVAPPSNDAAAPAPTRVEAALTLARADAALQRFFDDAVNGFKAGAGGFSSPGWRGVGATSQRIASRLPGRADQRFHLGLGPDERHTIQLTRDGAAPAEAELHAGRLLYPDVYPSTDLIAIATLDRFEELFVLRDASAPTRFSWRYELPRGIPAVSAQPDGALIFLDASGQPAIRLDRPFALDSQGQRRDANARVEGDHLVIDLDPTGLAYPVLLDPAYANALWTKEQDPSPPPARLQHAMTYHAASSVVLMFGGYDSSNVTPTLADTWTWNGTTKVWSAGAGGPAARYGHAMAYDAARGETVLFGGLDSTITALADTWVYAAGAWTVKCGSCVSGTTKPSARHGHAMAYDSVLQRVLLFGGNPGTGSDSELWAWDGSAGTWSKRCGAGCTAPTARTQAGMAYDAKNARTVIYGGTGGAIPDITVRYDSALDNYATIPTPVSPGLRNLAAVTYDSVRKKVIVFGGKASTVYLGDTWQLDGGTWELLPGPFGAPEPRSSAMAFDASTKRVVLYSGDKQSTDYKDTWTLYVRGDQCSSAADCDTGNCVDGVCCAVSGCGQCERCDLNGAQQSATGTCTKVISLDDPDSCTTANTCDAAGACKKKLGQICSAGGECVAGFCVDGRCCNASACGDCLSCGNAAGTCTTAVVNQDDDTCNGVKTCNAAGVCKSKTGQGCTLATDCASNNCADSTCCTDACTTPCRSCANASGTCTTAVVNQEDGTACGGINSCDGSGNCKKKTGQGCTTGTECISGNCIDSYCCDSTCSGGCDVCSAALGATQNGTCSVLASGAPGQCSPYKCGGTAACPSSCSSDQNCAPGHYCGGNICLPTKGLGLTCGAANECTSTYCADGVCCNTTCSSKCMACSAANKQSGTAAGTCDAAKQGTNPGNGCVVSSDPCGDQATCSGTPGECAKAANGKSCGPTTCANGAVSGKICNGSGVCVDQTNAQCAPYVCKGSACSSPCTADTDCQTDFYCAGGVCVGKSDNGKGCSAANTCKSGFCVDTVCCDSPCAGQCQACAEVGSVGQCKVVSGEPRAPRQACLGTAPDKCKGACDGANPTACTYPAAGTSCKDAACTGDVSQPQGACDGVGLCALPSTKNCLPYACNAGSGACNATCSSDTDCAQGAKCDTTQGKCAVTSATCSDPFTVLLPNGQSQSCSPYRCVGGACQQQCSSANDCATGFTCEGAVCVAADGGTDSGLGRTSGSGGSATGGSATGGSATGGSATGGSATGGNSTGGKKSSGSGDDGGCGCRVQSSGSGTSAYWLAALALAALRRRRTARPSRRGGRPGRRSRNWRPWSNAESLL
ncbi:MAG: hypothetical protein IPI67_17000 [Myxococcales bacterium]|nr:hypothetical protein [Myxococcales bacterium]